MDSFPIKFNGVPLIKFRQRDRRVEVVKQPYMNKEIDGNSVSWTFVPP